MQQQVQYPIQHHVQQVRPVQQQVQYPIQQQVQQVIPMQQHMQYRIQQQVQYPVQNIYYQQIKTPPGFIKPHNKSWIRKKVDEMVLNNNDASAILTSVVSNAIL